MRDTKGRRTAPPAERFGIGELSRRTGVNIETVRYYERIGLVPKPPRTERGHRVYDQRHRKRLAFVRRSRELGFSLGDIRLLLELVDGGAYTCAEVKTMTLAHAEHIRRKVADLERMERILKDMAAQCDGGDVPACAIVDALSS